MVSPIFSICPERTYGVLIAQSEITLSVALGDFDGVVDVVNGHRIVDDVLHTSRAASTLQVCGKGRGDTRPDFDASTILVTVLAVMATW